MIAVSAWFDEEAEGAIRDLWRRMAEAAVDDSLHTGPYRPHVTLGVWEEAPFDETLTRLEALAKGLAPIAVTFRALGMYPGHANDPARAPGLWLAPTVTPELQKLHEQTHSGLADVASGAVHRHVPGRWEPHCTIASNLTRASLPHAAEIAIDAGILPLAATVTHLGVIDTPAEVELDRIELS